MPVGAYSQRLRNAIRHTDQRVILEFWGNDVQLDLGDWIVMGWVDKPGSMTACHNVADTLVVKAGTGGTTTVVSGAHDMSGAVAAVRNGGYIMEIKFHKDHSVCLISTTADSQVEILEGWAGGGEALGSVEPYMFVKTVYEDHNGGRIPKGTAADALDGACQGNDLARNVGLLTRCIADACGISAHDFKVTVKYRQLDNINTFDLAAGQSIARYTREVSEIVYRNTMPGTSTGLRCRECFKKKPPWRITQGYWHHCATCREVHCDACGKQRDRPAHHGYFGSDWTRHRICSNGHTMVMF